jgi:tRNA nucleotidyltransferase (CCA-adding enzyme)
MKTYLNNLPKEIQNLIRLTGDIASQNNMYAYLVGGFVRDLILGAKNLDLDIVVEGEGIKFAEALAQRLQAKLIRHRRFGTATVILKKRLKVDIATARREYYPQPAQLPEVTPGTLKDDLIRRDFTINAMAISINQSDFGRFIDFFGGKEDLFLKKIRILHDLSFIDDPTRILRAIRFEQRYNFKIEPKTLRLLKEAVRLKMLEKTQPQRLRDELILILKEEHPLKQLKRIKGLTGFKFVNPGLSLSQKTTELLKSIQGRIDWFRKNYPRRRQLDTWLIYLIGLLEPLDINKIRSVCKRFAFRRGEEKRILNYKKMSRKIIQELSRMKIKPSKIFTLLEPLSYEVIILIKAKSRNIRLQKHIEIFFEIYNGMRPYICGEDLRKLGIAPSPFYQKVFTKVLEAKLNGLVKTKEEELLLIKKLIRA